MLVKPITLHKKPLKNQFVMPPLVCFNWADELGYETVSRALHYGKRAAGGAGLIVVEATAISAEGRITNSELGLWEDGHIEQFKKMAEACHAESSLILVQLVHAGTKATGWPREENFIMPKEMIDQTIQDFVEAAIRAEKAGLDGVEIHGAHGYLINQFTSSASNHRTDNYGGSFENRSRLAIEIVRAVKKAVGDDFVIGYRFGCNDPTLEEDIALAKRLEGEGVTFFNVSAGIGYQGLTPPNDFPFSPITYMGVALSKHLSSPCACVFGIKKPEEAQTLLETYQVPLVAIGRGFLADPEWGAKALSGQTIDVCIECSGGCQFRYDGHRCPFELRRSAASKA